LGDKTVEEEGTLAYMLRPGTLEFRHYAVPETVGPGALLLRVVQTNVCGSDVHVFDGHHPHVKSGGLGHEMVGRIARLGEGVSCDSAGVPVAVGDRVVPVYTSACGHCLPCSRGDAEHCTTGFQRFGRVEAAPHYQGCTFASHYYLHADQKFYRVPDGVSDTAASGANCALSQVLYGLDVADVKLGETVVVQGAGGLGVLATAIARQRGARVIVLDRVSTRLDVARAFGAHDTVDVDRFADAAALRAHVDALTGGGADVAVEVTGVPAVFAEGIFYLRPKGRYAVMGTISPGLTTMFDPGALVRRSVTIHGINRYPPDYLRRALQFLAEHERELPMERLFDAQFPLEQLQLALEKSKRREIQRATIRVEETLGR
jgi:threonine dehydrogenase-like Zn-dependent dehydrogenase